MEASDKNMMKQLKKLLSFLTMICCLAGSVAPVYATEQNSAVPRAVFTNEPKESPDLYVTKEVQNAVDGYSASEYDRFQFVLKLNGVIAKNVEYHVIDPVYGEIFKGNWMGTTIPFQTDNSGVFTLKAGQTAWFEYIGTGVRYEVHELDTYLSAVTNEYGQIEWEGDAAYFYKEEWDDEYYMQWMEDAPVYETKSFTEGGYQCQTPASGSTGEHGMLSTGRSEKFVNRYTPKTDSATTTLEVTKDTAFPTDYHAPETPDFTFLLEVDGKPYANEIFTITGEDREAIDPADQANKADAEVSVHQTDANGRFTLKGGQTASFAEVPTDVDYRVSELIEGKDGLPEGWWAIGDTAKEGATQSPLTSVTFRNANTSFAVTKTMTDNDKPDVDFTFRLTDEKNNAMTGKRYLLYYTTGQPVYQTNDDGTSKIDANGKKIIAEGYTALDTDGTLAAGEFTLKPGQTAVFTGIRPGTAYRVRETAHPGYTQTLPLPTENDLYEVSTEGEVAVWDFVNQKTDLKGSLSVTKQVQTTNEGSLTKDTFHFILYQRLKTQEEVKETIQAQKGLLTQIADALTGSDDLNTQIEEALKAGWLAAVEAETSTSSEEEFYYQKGDKSYELYRPARREIYRVPEGLSNPSYFTGPDEAKGLEAGEFTLTAEQTAHFEDLSADREYLVRETGLTEEYTEIIGSDSNYIDLLLGTSEETPVKAQKATLTSDGLAFTFQNQYTPKKLDLKIIKTDDRGEYLAGAEFMLYLDRGEHPILPDGETDENFRYITAGSEGSFTIRDLKAGTYWLYERKAPSDYCLLKEPIKIEIIRTKEGLSVLIDGKTQAQIVGGSSNVVTNMTMTPSTEGQNDQIALTVQNLYLYELPNSGGAGIYWYTISGILLMLAAVWILYKNKYVGEG